MAGPRLYTCMGLLLPRCRTFHFPVKLHEIPRLFSLKTECGSESNNCLPFTSVKMVRKCWKCLLDQVSRMAEVTGTLLLQNINRKRVANMRTKLSHFGT